MKPFPHRYEVRLTSGPRGHATVSVAGLPPMHAAPPYEFDGPGDAWSPEHLLLAAVETCFLFTFRAIASAAHVEFLAIDVITEGVVERIDEVTRFTEIVVRPHVTLALGADRARAYRVVARAERACIVSASLATPVRVEPEIETEAIAAAG